MYNMCPILYMRFVKIYLGEFFLFTLLWRHPKFARLSPKSNTSPRTIHQALPSENKNQPKPGRFIWAKGNTKPQTSAILGQILTVTQEIWQLSKKKRVYIVTDYRHWRIGVVIIPVWLQIDDQLLSGNNKFCLKLPHAILAIDKYGWFPYQRPTRCNRGTLEGTPSARSAEDGSKMHWKWQSGVPDCKWSYYNKC